MLEREILPATLIVLSATILLTAQVSFSEATTDGCKNMPSSSAPPGSHWYYRVNRADNRHCWYLSSEGMKVRWHAGRAGSHDASPIPVPQRKSAAEIGRATPSKVATDEPVFPKPSIHEHPTATDFAARWRELPKSHDLDASELAVVGGSYADRHPAMDAEDQMSLRWPVISAERTGLTQDSTSQATFGSVFLIGAFVVASVLLAGGVFKRAGPRHRTDRRDHRTASRQHGHEDCAETTGRWSRAETRHDAAVQRTPTPTDPAHDLKKSLRELMDDLQRAEGANDSLRSFAPPVRQMSKRSADQMLSKRNSDRNLSAFQIAKSQGMHFAEPILNRKSRLYPGTLRPT